MAASVSRDLSGRILNFAPQRIAALRATSPRSAAQRNATSPTRREPQMARSPFERSDETTAIINYLRLFDKGTVVPYPDLSRLIDKKVVARFPKLTVARNILQRDFNQVWTCVRPGVGVQRLTDMEIAERLPRFWLTGARNKLTRGGNQAEVVEIGELDLDQQARFSVDSIQRELAFDALSKAMRRKMERVARGTSNDLPAFTAIEWAINLSPKNRK
jgi:hypothetical protein